MTTTASGRASGRAPDDGPGRTPDDGPGPAPDPVPARAPARPPARVVDRRRIWGWMFFDVAQQPYATLGLTFIFSPYVAEVAQALFMARDGLDAEAAKAQASAFWTSGQTIAGLIIALTAPFLGAWADASGRKMRWITLFSLIAIPCFAAMWFLMPDGTNLIWVVALFWLGFIAAESAANVNNAMLPSLTPGPEIGRISGSATAFGYWGGVVALAIMLLLFAENASGVTLLGAAPALGLDPAMREGTRFVGPIVAIWMALFLVPFFLWCREPVVSRARPSLQQVTAALGQTVRDLRRRPSLGSFLLSSMLYRDALSAIYSVGGVYAALVLGWSVIQVGVFGIIAAIAAAIISWLGGLADRRVGPRPVIVASCWALILVSLVVVGMNRQAFFGVPLPDGSILPDVIFYICGALIGGAGGTIYSASRTMMVRHTTPETAGEAFGLFALTGRATAFLAPALITAATWATGSQNLGYTPLVVLFLIALWLLRWTKPHGDLGPEGAPVR